MFAALAAFKEKEHHCNIPQQWRDDPSLGTWVRSQRQAYKKDQLSTDRISRLEILGFVWEPLDAAWEEMFAALAEFKEKELHCNVPRGWADNPSLGQWASTQRTFRKNGKLSPDREARLEALGFAWTRA